jgi:hypothetical protein
MKKQKTGYKMVKKEPYYVYCDESRQTIDRYMVLGGLIIQSNEIKRFNDTMEKFRSEQKMFAELKWSKVSEQKISEYKRFVEYFFALNNTDILHFHCMIIDNHSINHKKFSQGNKEIGFYKLYYQLLLHCFGNKYCSNRTLQRLIVILDHRESKYKLSDLKFILNNGINKRYGINYEPYVNVESRDSKKSNLIQINDIILGAVGFQKNGYHLLAESKKSKIELAEYIAEKAGLNNLIDNTGFRNKRFTIWNFKLRK